MSYYINLKSFTVDQLQHKLANTRLLPSQEVLKEAFDTRFNLLRSLGLENLYEVQQVLKTKDKVQQFSDATGLPVDYLTILRREINSYHPKPRKIADFNCLSDDVKAKLKILGIKNTVKLYDLIAKKKSREVLKNAHGISESQVVLLAKLTDLCRVRYVNADFACLLNISGYDSISKLKKANYLDLYHQLTTLNKGKKYYRGIIGQKDMAWFVNEAQFLETAIEW